MTLGDRIRENRLRCGMSQEKLAESMGVSRQAVTKWEAGRSAPSTDNLFKLAELFGTTVDQLADPRENVAPAPASPAALHCRAEENARNGWKQRLGMALLTAAGYLLIFLLGRILCGRGDNSSVLGWLFGTDSRQTTYLFGWLLSSRMFLIASAVSILPSIWGKYRFSLATLSGFLIGLLLGEALGPNPAQAAYGRGHYGWAIWGGIFLASLVAGILLERFLRPESSQKAKLACIWTAAALIVGAAVIALVCAVLP